MKLNNLLASLAAVLMSVSGVQGQSIKPGTVTFKNIHGTVVSQNVNTGATEEITTESLLTEGFVIDTDADGYLDIVFSNGVISRLAPNSRVTIESFAVTGGRRSSEAPKVFENSPSDSTSTVSNLHLKIECGDLLVNATEKEEGELLVKTPTAEVTGDLSKFFLSHGGSSAVGKNVSRAINLGSMPINVTTRAGGEFTESNEQVSYGYYDAYSEVRTVTLDSEASAVIISENDETEYETNSDANDLVGQTTTAVEQETSYGNETNPYGTEEDSMGTDQYCDKTQYSLLPYDRCIIDRLSAIADHSLYGGNDPMGTVLILTAAADSSYYNLDSTEIGEVTAGMMLAEGTIIRTGGDGPVTAVFPNGTVLTIEPASNVFLELISTQPVLSNPTVENQTNITVRVESGRIVANTVGSPITDTFVVISPLDRHMVASDTVVSVEFLQMEDNAFQTVSQNRTPEGSNGVNTVVVTSTDLSFVSDTVTFIEYAQQGSEFSFSTPPSYTHITESAIIPPGYEFIDRTIAFAAVAIPSPADIGTPGNPGNTQRFTDEEDPVSP